MPEAPDREAAVKAARVVVRYDGEGVSNGTMDVQTLAPALLALGELCDYVNREVNPHNARVSVKVSAFETGCFDVFINIGVAFPASIPVALGLSGGIVGAHQFLKILFGKDYTDYGLVGFFKKINGRRITSVTKLQNGRVTVEVANSDGGNKEAIKNVPEKVYALSKDPQVRRNTQRFVAPLRTGIDEITVIDKDTDAVREAILKDELPAFDALTDFSEPDSVEWPPSEIEATYTVITISSDSRANWVLRGPNSRITVKIANPQLYELARKGHLDIKLGYIIRAKIRTELRLVNGKLKPDNYLLEILSAKPPPPGMESRLQRLFEDEADESEDRDR